MSIPEAPFDGEAHARKEGAWVLAYGKTALNQFVELVKSYMDGCKKYYEDTKALVANLVEDVDPEETEPQCRLNGEWVPAGGGSALRSRLIYVDSPSFDLMPEDNVVVLLANTNNPGAPVELILPNPEDNFVLTIIIPHSWRVDSKMKLLGAVTVKSPAHPVHNATGVGDAAQFILRGEYRGYFIDGEWYFTEAMEPAAGPEMPS